MESGGAKTRPSTALASMSKPVGRDAKAGDPLADAAVVTEIDADFVGDAFVPQFGPDWVESARERQTSSTGLSFSFVTYCRNTGV